MKRLPITLISGMSGTGKSSLIECVRAGLNGSRLGIIRDDGERDILADIQDLAESRACDYLLIENTPDGEPFPTCELLVEGDDYGLAPEEFCRVDCAVTIIDASTFLEDVTGRDLLMDRGLDRSLDMDVPDPRSVSEVLIEQVEFADLIVINKIDLIPNPDGRARIIALLQRLNPRAGLIETVFGRVSIRDVLDTGTFDLDSTDQDGAGWLAQLEGLYDELAPEFGVTSFTYESRRPFHPIRFNHLIENFDLGRRRQDLRGPNGPNGPNGIVRGKGSIWVGTRHHEIGVWSLAGETSLLTYGGAWMASTPVREWPKDEAERAEIMREWQPPFGDRRQEIAFIGLEMDEAAIRAGLNACLMTDDEMRDGPDSWRSIPDPLPDWHFDTDEEPYGGNGY
jgi:G3E family GTPase